METKTVNEQLSSITIHQSSSLTKDQLPSLTKDYLIINIKSTLNNYYWCHIKASTLIEELLTDFCQSIQNHQISFINPSNSCQIKLNYTFNDQPNSLIITCVKTPIEILNLNIESKVFDFRYESHVYLITYSKHPLDIFITQLIQNIQNGSYHNYQINYPINNNIHHVSLNLGYVLNNQHGLIELQGELSYSFDGNCLIF